jgi:hypothetical protein
MPRKCIPGSHGLGVHARLALKAQAQRVYSLPAPGLGWARGGRILADRVESKSEIIIVMFGVEHYIVLGPFAF